MCYFLSFEQVALRRVSYVRDERTQNEIETFLEVKTTSLPTIQKVGNFLFQKYASHENIADSKYEFTQFSPICTTELRTDCKIACREGAPMRRCLWEAWPRQNLDQGTRQAQETKYSTWDYRASRKDASLQDWAFHAASLLKLQGVQDNTLTQPSQREKAELTIQVQNLWIIGNCDYAIRHENTTQRTAIWGSLIYPIHCCGLHVSTVIIDQPIAFRVKHASYSQPYELVHRLVLTLKFPLIPVEHKKRKYHIGGLSRRHHYLRDQVMPGGPSQYYVGSGCNLENDRKNTKATVWNSPRDNPAWANILVSGPLKKH